MQIFYVSLKIIQIIKWRGQRLILFFVRKLLPMLLYGTFYDSKWMLKWWVRIIFKKNLVLDFYLRYFYELLIMIRARCEGCIIQSHDNIFVLKLSLRCGWQRYQKIIKKFLELFLSFWFSYKWMGHWTENPMSFLWRCSWIIKLDLIYKIITRFF